MLYEIEKEAARRAEIFKALDIIIRDRFIITPGDRKKRLRRHVIHNVVLGQEWANGGNWRMKKLVQEKLISMGVGLLLTTGRRFYTGIELREKGR